MNQENVHQPSEPEHLRIVVLDDEEWAREFLKAQLNSLYQGIEIVGFADGADAWAELSRRTPDLLITDYNHLGMGCDELFRRLAEAKKACPIILVSGFAEMPVFKEFVATIPELGLNVDVLAKPYRPEQLEALLAKHLGPPTTSLYHHNQAKQQWPLEDKRHLEAAQGWFELGNHLEANEELENITPKNRAHPAVLEIRWQIYAKAKKWDAALDIASALIQQVPEHPLGWVHRSPRPSSAIAIGSA